KQISDHNCFNTSLSTVEHYGTLFLQHSLLFYLLYPILFSLSSNQRSFHNYNCFCLHVWTLSDKQIVLTLVSSISLV
ncbi:hypothetical protein N310_11960, partial [Acanthisitta chloris]